MFYNDPLDPCNPVDWRWQAAAFLRSQKQYARRVKLDEHIPLVKRYQVAKEKTKEVSEIYTLRYKYPGIFWADRIHGMENRNVRWQIEARLLARQPFEEIAKKVRTTPEVVMWYERLFYSVLPMIDHTDYILNFAIGEACHRGLKDREYDMLWKMVGYFMGSIALEVLINPLESCHIESVGEMSSAFRAAAKSQADMKAWLAWKTINVNYNQVNVISLWNEMLNIERQAGENEKSQSMLSQNIQQALTSFKFSTAAPVAVPGQESYDGMHAELRTQDQVALSLGKNPRLLLGMKDIKFPEKTEAKDGQNDEGNPG